MRETIGDECIYLRINELKSGNIQFTDSTNARRLFREHGESIRYMAAWKKWLVWNGSRWRIGLVREPGWFPNKSCIFSEKFLKKCWFLAEVFLKLKFPKNSIDESGA